MILEVTQRSSELVRKLYSVWEQSVRKTHLFLQEKDIDNISPFVPKAILSVQHLIVAKDNKGDCVGFMGIENHKIEMLFVHPDQIGRGVGKSLILEGMDRYLADEVCVNEQNNNAFKFYEHFGFKSIKRSETDEQGNNFPILYLKLSKKKIF